MGCQPNPRVGASQPPNADGVVGEAPLEITVGLSFFNKLANVDPRRPRLPNRMMLGLYVLLKEWDRPLADTMALSSEVAQEIIDPWSPFNKMESSVAHMSNFFPTLL